MLYVFEKRELPEIKIIYHFQVKEKKVYYFTQWHRTCKWLTIEDWSLIYRRLDIIVAKYFKNNAETSEPVPEKMVETIEDCIKITARVLPINIHISSIMNIRKDYSKYYVKVIIEQCKRRTNKEPNCTTSVTDSESVSTKAEKRHREYSPSKTEVAEEGRYSPKPKTDGSLCESKKLYKPTPKKIALQNLEYEENEYIPVCKGTPITQKLYKPTKIEPSPPNVGESSQPSTSSNQWNLLKKNDDDKLFSDNEEYIVDLKIPKPNGEIVKILDSDELSTVSTDIESQSSSRPVRLVKLKNINYGENDVKPSLKTKPHGKVKNNGDGIKEKKKLSNYLFDDTVDENESAGSSTMSVRNKKASKIDHYFNKSRADDDCGGHKEKQNNDMIDDKHSLRKDKKRKKELQNPNLLSPKIVAHLKEVQKIPNLPRTQNCLNLTMENIKQGFNDVKPTLDKIISNYFEKGKRNFDNNCRDPLIVHDLFSSDQLDFMYKHILDTYLPPEDSGASYGDLVSSFLLPAWCLHLYENLHNKSRNSLF